MSIISVLLMAEKLHRELVDDTARLQRKIELTKQLILELEELSGRDAEKAMDRIKGTPGLCARLAKELGISPQAVSQWHIVPVERVLEVERITDMPRDELRPDIYPQPSPQRGSKMT
jgi:hypothetical protein